MLDKLIDIVLEFIDRIVPFVVINYYDRGIRLRLGKPRGMLQPGFHWKIPFADDIITHMVKATTLNLAEQSLTTKDNQQLVIKVALKYEVEDVETLLLEVSSPVDALSDMACGIVRDKVISRNWNECNEDKLTGDISRAVKAEARKWGISVQTVTITDLGLIRSIRLLNK